MSKRVMFLRASNGHPVGCIAIALNKLTSTVQYQVSVLNPSDQFDRAIARQLAIGRLVESPITITVRQDANRDEISFAIMEHIVLSGKNALPSRAIKAAKLWLSEQ